MKLEQEINELKRRIEYEESQYRIAIEYPQETNQFYRALSRHWSLIEQMRNQLEEIIKKGSIK